MHMILRCPEGQCADGAALPVSGPEAPDPAGSIQVTMPFMLYLEQNRSTVPESGRGALLALIGLSVAATIIPAIRGYYLVPIAILSALGALVLALEYFARKPVPSETVEIDRDRLTIRDHLGRTVQMPSYWTRLEEIRSGPDILRLVLRCGDRSVELGRCLHAVERAEVAPLVRAGLRHARGGV